jgi:DNA repair photolyase
MLGCSHGCLYCYARAQAIRWKKIASPADWQREREQPIPRRAEKRAGVIMFPTTHDITPGNVEHCLPRLRMLLAAGNQVLIVSKPHVVCVERMIRALETWRRQIEYRFSIGAVDQAIQDFWEPGAPDLLERLASLNLAWRVGYRTSVSCEPLLEPARAADLVAMVEAHVTDTIWIGKANKLRERTAWMFTPEQPEDRLRALNAEITRVEAGQTDAAVLEVYARLGANLKVRWKDSYREVIARSVSHQS